MPRSRRFSPVLCRTIAATLLLVAACDAPRPTGPGQPLARESSGSGALKDAALFVGNAQIGGATNGVLRYDGRGEFIDRFVPEGTAGLTIGCCLTFGPDENLYVSSPLEGRVLRFNGVTGAFIDEFVPTGPGVLVPLIPLFHEGRFYVGDLVLGKIFQYDGTTGAYLGEFIDTRPQGTGFGDPQFFEFGRDGNVYLASQSTDRILRYDGHTGAFIDAFVPSGPDGIVAPSGITFGPDGLLYASSTVTGEVRRYDAAGKLVDVFVSPGSGGLSLTVGITFGPDGNLYTADALKGNILRFDGRTGAFIDAFVPTGRGGMDGPRAIQWKAKTTVCHRGRTLSIGYLSGADHLGHGDTLGRCAG